ncbi:tRNA(Ile)-lysidine synthetase [Ligilactobacillus salitolerans]|uniref:tRNA(Ile)-lysidine synthase n=1 Tax=Ligilactobacillus salitolerans TaxID=1808352 RepID=A0A401IRZ7_9LACO|nr:tRNA lysidine(34) synthetase TilS [Ligilactobacillus salitolerans]GBG94312.1 tRNA(Ile)-lysidine synthetase [Ligilactobacillus salitolerans]
MNLGAQFIQIWSQLGIGRQRVVVAVSGGVDSVVLLDLLQKLPVDLSPELIVANVDHCLRTESQAESAYLKKFCEQRSLQFETTRWLPDDHPQTGIEGAARDFRYRFFAQVMKKSGAQVLLTAHHGDDQAETFLMKMLRGGDLAQLTGIKSKRSFHSEFTLCRPLLYFSKQQLYFYARSNQLTYFEDQTNAKDDTLRNRLRHQAVPLLKQEDPRFLEHIASFEEQLDDVLQLAKVRTRQVLELLKVEQGYSVSRFQQLPSAEKNAALRALSAEFLSETNDQQVREQRALLENPAKPQGMIRLKHNYVFIKEYDYFRFEHVQKQADISMAEYPLQLGQWQTLSAGEKIGLFPAGTPILASDDVLELGQKEPQLTVRHRLPGDKLLTAAGKQKVKKILIDQKVPFWQRDHTWVVSLQAGEILWVVGAKKSDLSRQSVNDKIHYIVIYRKISREKGLPHE